MVWTRVPQSSVGQKLDSPDHDPSGGWKPLRSRAYWKKLGSCRLAIEEDSGTMSPLLILLPGPREITLLYCTYHEALPRHRYRENKAKKHGLIAEIEPK